MAVADIEHPALVRLDFGVERAAFRHHARGFTGNRSAAE
jgi:hypothetical protein